MCGVSLGPKMRGDALGSPCLSRVMMVICTWPAAAHRDGSLPRQQLIKGLCGTSVLILPTQSSADAMRRIGAGRCGVMRCDAMCETGEGCRRPARKRGRWRRRPEQGRALNTPRVPVPGSQVVNEPINGSRANGPRTRDPMFGCWTARLRVLSAACHPSTFSARSPARSPARPPPHGMLHIAGAPRHGSLT